jgi:GTP-binding protein
VDIRTVAYAGTVGAPTQAPPDELPEIAFSGRSNVGKSSLINVLLRRTRRKLAHVSATPGKTRALNFYRVNERFFLVDLPGFGYARVPGAAQADWQALIEGYLAKSPRLRGVVHLVDARHAPTDLDHRMMAYLARIGTPTIVVATKMDKLRAREREPNLARVRDDLAITEDQLVPFSSHTGEGREELLEALAELLGVEGRDEV